MFNALSILYLTLLIGAMGWTQFFLGGIRPAFCLPAYALLAFAGLLSVISIWKKRARPNLACVLGTTIFFGYVLARGAFSPVEYLARADMALAAACLIVYGLTAFYLVEPWQRLTVVGALLVLALVQVGVGVTQFARGDDFMLFEFARLRMGTRASGMFRNPNHFAAYLEMVGMLALNLVWWSRLRLSWKVVVAYAGLCCYAGVVFSASRGGYLSSTISLGFWTLLTLYLTHLHGWRSFGKTLLVAGGVVGAILCVALWMISQHYDLQQRFAIIFNPEVRSVLRDAALDQFHLQPEFGTGAGTYLIYGRLFRRPMLPTDPIHAHNDYLELLAEYGIAGAIGFVLFILPHLVAAFRALPRMARSLPHLREDAGDTLALNSGALCAIIAIGAHCWVDFNLHIPANALVVAFLFGVIAQPGGSTAKDARGFGIASIFAAILPLLSICQAFFDWRRLPAEVWSERALTWLIKQEFSKSAEYANRALRYDPTIPDARYRLGEAYRLEALETDPGGERRALLIKAFSAHLAGRRIFPQDENILIRLAQTLDSLHQFDHAEAIYQEALSWDPHLPALLQLYTEHQQYRAKVESWRAKNEADAANKPALVPPETPPK